MVGYRLHRNNERHDFSGFSLLSRQATHFACRRNARAYITLILLTCLSFALVGCSGSGGAGSESETSTANSASGTATDAGVNASSPFGVAAHFDTLTSIAPQASDLGFRAIRLAGPQAIVWDRVKQTGWTNDSLYAELTAAGYELSVVVLAGNPAASTTTLTEYGAFITELVERYDGDGVADAPGSPHIAIIEIDNEPDLYEGAQEQTPWRGELSETGNYATMLRTAYAAAKTANPQVKVAIGGMAFNVDYYSAILTTLGGATAFDFFNFHYYGTAENYFQTGVQIGNGTDVGPSLTEVHSLLNSTGYGEVPIIVTETATYSGTTFLGAGAALPEQTERKQAISLVRRYLYAATRGVSRLYWYQPLGTGGTALVNGSKAKLSYYAYKRMVDELDGADFAGVEIVWDGNAGVYIQKLRLNNNPFWVMWRDGDESLGTTNVTIAVDNLTSLRLMTSVPPGTAGADLNPTSYASLFPESVISPVAGEITVAVGAVPLYLRP